MTSTQYLSLPSGSTHLDAGHRRTYCGMVVKPSRFVRGDETISGVAATCRHCKHSFLNED